MAPDSGIPDENWENFTPPPQVTHFHKGKSNQNIADLEFFHHYLKPVTKLFPNCNNRKFSFLFGYFFHLITDNLWSQKIGNPLKIKFSQEFKKDPNMIWEIKRDWYGLDFAYIRNHPDSIFFNIFIESTFKENYLDFIQPEAIQQNLEYIKNFYQRTDDEVERSFIERPNMYLSETEMDNFVSYVSEYLFIVYHYLNESKKDINNFWSILQIKLVDNEYIELIPSN